MTDEKHLASKISAKIQLQVEKFFLDHSKFIFRLVCLVPLPAYIKTVYIVPACIMTVNVLLLYSAVLECG